jgi:hypothetical protein
MSLHVIQRTEQRTGRQVRRISLELACPHGRAACALLIPAFDGLPAAWTADLQAQATHVLVRHVVSHHRHSAGCSCAERAAMLWWPAEYQISTESVSPGGSRHA